jgi:hypothetical protein
VVNVLAVFFRKLWQPSPTTVPRRFAKAGCASGVTE